MVGGALNRYFKSTDIEAVLYDPPKGLDDREALDQAEVIFVAVPTPYYLDEKGFDDSFLHQAIQTLTRPGKTIAIKSTVIPGTTDQLQARYPQHRFLFSPEFLTEATADYDLVHPNRQIIGYTPESQKDAEPVMRLLPRAPFEKIVSAKAAEMIKYFGNAFYALKVAYANQMYDLCQALGIDYDQVKECSMAEPWIGKQHLEVNHKGYRGYGGKCLPKDTRAIIQLARKNGIDLTLLKNAEAYNNELTSSQGLDIQWTEGSPQIP